MNKQEHSLRILSVVLIIGGVVLQIFHTTAYGNGYFYTLFGFMFGLIAYINYSARLKAENAALQQRFDARQ
ncbi:hypothetical protein [Hymenobacter wooponensis]|uniref:Uncharacterized protein n=1 Tax=Hymenobacter wooponensis TaxID=1525360 RepID=A0A4Z0MJC4_9BACT|nr:hypothetical protein [Hymenobacter wooponensis]TGD79606.1 hypothetical protein EU557_15410 [Hymenobacter wooponensis]